MMEFTVDKLKEKLSKMISDIPPKDLPLLFMFILWLIQRKRGRF